MPDLVGSLTRTQTTLTAHELAPLLKRQGPETFVLAMTPDGRTWRIAASTDPTRGDDVDVFFILTED